MITEIVSKTERIAYMRLIERLLSHSRFRQIRNVIIHGGDTPTNFLFTGNGDMAAIDVERMKFLRHGVRHWNGPR